MSASQDWREDITDDLASCRDCDTQWIGEGAWDAAMAHAHATSHHVHMTGRV